MVVQTMLICSTAQGYNSVLLTPGYVVWHICPDYLQPPNSSPIINVCFWQDFCSNRVMDVLTLFITSTLLWHSVSVLS